MAKNAMKVVVYVRADDAKFLEHATQGETPRWVRATVRRAIQVMREKEAERERSV
jgi:hypothetical protein